MSRDVQSGISTGGRIYPVGSLTAQAACNAVRRPLLDVNPLAGSLNPVDAAFGT
ncbi:MAG: hypothetical protein AAF649_01385 [Verrucomicrobiota bacterium]